MQVLFRTIFRFVQDLCVLHSWKYGYCAQSVWEFFGQLRAPGLHACPNLASGAATCFWTPSLFQWPIQRYYKYIRVCSVQMYIEFIFLTFRPTRNVWQCVLRCRLEKLSLHLSRTGLAPTEALLKCNLTNRNTWHLFLWIFLFYVRIITYRTAPFEHLSHDLQAAVRHSLGACSLSLVKKDFLSVYFMVSPRTPEDCLAIPAFPYLPSCPYRLYLFFFVPDFLLVLLIHALLTSLFSSPGQFSLRVWATTVKRKKIKKQKNYGTS